jgi:hypothetical protein
VIQLQLDRARRVNVADQTNGDDIGKFALPVVVENDRVRIVGLQPANDMRLN